MENKNQENQNRPVMLKDFNEFRKVSKRDFKEFTDVSEKRFKEFTDRAFSTFATKDDIKHLPTKEDMERYKDEILEAKDEMVGKVDDAMTEFKMKSASDLRRDEEIEEHEKRITHVETKLGVSPAAT